MSRHGPKLPPSSSPPAPKSRQPHITFGRQQKVFLRRMSQHKYNPRQMLFVKNVPQESAVRIASLFTEYKPLETKNLYPDSRVTTFLITLPSISATDDALRDTDGLRVGNTVITVERYNPKQSVVARRDARRKCKNTVNEHSEYCYEEDDYNYDEFDEDGDTRIDQDTKKAAKLVPKQPEPKTSFAPPRTRRVSESGGISWANIAGGTQTALHTQQPEHHLDSPASHANVEAPRQKHDEAESFSNFDLDIQEESLRSLSLSVDASTTKCFSSPNFSAPAATLPSWQHLSRITITPPSTSSSPRPTSSQSQSSKGLSHDPFSAPSKGLKLSEAKYSQHIETSRAGNDSGKRGQLPVLLPTELEGLDMPVDTTGYLRARHGADCSFCKTHKLRAG